MTDELVQDYRADNAVDKPRVLALEITAAASIRCGTSGDLYEAWSSYAQVLNEAARQVRSMSTTLDCIRDAEA